VKKNCIAQDEMTCRRQVIEVGHGFLFIQILKYL